ncbi:MAG: phytochelatin synthase family protein [Calothrix sp. MO_167.B42]|nr:phytochelatin synthase family protein [Calothrix sp. MO_167.B42]
MKNSPFQAMHHPIKALLLGALLSGGSVFAQSLPLPPSLIAFNSVSGQQLLIESKSREDFFPLSMHFTTQDNLAYCGVASIVMVLNSLGIPAPATPKYRQYRVFTQENFFSNSATQKVLSKEIVSQRGMTLEQLGGLFASYNVKVKIVHGSEITLEEFRRQVVENLKQPGNYVVVNYLRKAIGQKTGGHISPLAAYNEKMDRFLILDVSRYKYPPVWVKTADLWKAMNTKDSASGKTRGFVFVDKGS